MPIRGVQFRSHKGVRDRFLSARFLDSGKIGATKSRAFYFRKVLLRGIIVNGTKYRSYNWGKCIVVCVYCRSYLL